MRILREYNSATTVHFALYTRSGGRVKANATFAAGDVKIMKDEASEVNIGTLPTDQGNGYSLPLTAAELSCARATVYIIDQTSPHEWMDQVIHIETYGHASAQHPEFPSDAADEVTALTGKVDTIDTVVDAVKAKTDNLPADPASESNVTAVGAAAVVIDGNVDAIKLVTDKLDDTLEDDGGTQRFTANALEESPAGPAVAKIDGIKAQTDKLQFDGGDRVYADVEAIEGSAALSEHFEKALNVIVAGAAVTGTLSTTQMTTNLLETTNDHYVGRTIIWTSGALTGQAATITAYNGSSKMLTFTETTDAPANGDGFLIT